MNKTKIQKAVEKYLKKEKISKKEFMKNITNCNYNEGYLNDLMRSEEMENVISFWFIHVNSSSEYWTAAEVEINKPNHFYSIIYDHD